jgi:hypothetical protein
MCRASLNASLKLPYPKSLTSPWSFIFQLADFNQILQSTLSNLLALLNYLVLFSPSQASAALLTSSKKENQRHPCRNSVNSKTVSFPFLLSGYDIYTEISPFKLQASS